MTYANAHALSWEDSNLSSSPIAIHKLLHISTDAFRNKNEAGVSIEPSYHGAKSDIEKLFNRHIQQWTNDVKDLSSFTQMLSHPSYQAIIGMGRRVVPLLLNELAKRPHYLFAALRAIFAASGEKVDPVPAEYAGNLQKMTDAWIKWGEREGYI